MTTSNTKTANFVLFDPALLKPAISQSFVKLTPNIQWRNPVMSDFCVCQWSICAKAILFGA